MFKYSLDLVTLPVGTMVVELMPRENRVEEHEFSVSSDKVYRQVGEGQGAFVMNPVINIPFGRVLKVGTGSVLGIEVGDYVYLPDEVGLVNHNPVEENPFPYMIRYGFWLNPQLRNRVMTNLVQVPDTLVTGVIKGVDYES